MVSPLAYIHSKARIHPSATIGPGASIGPQVVIEKDVQVDSGANIGYGQKEGSDQPVILKEGVLVSTGSVIYHSVVLEPFVKVRHNVIVRENVTVGRESSIGSLSTIEHNCVIGVCCSLHSRIHLTDFSEVGDYVFIGPGFVSMSDMALSYRRPALRIPFSGVRIASKVRIGGGVLAMPGSVIGEEAVIGAGTFVRGHLKGGYLYMGNPIRSIRKIEEREFLP